MSKYLTYGLIALSLGLIAFLLIRMNRLSAMPVYDEGFDAPLPSPDPVLPYNSRTVNCSRKIWRGSKGVEVEEFQKWYNQANLSGPPADGFSFAQSLSVDGNFGPKTESAARIAGFTSGFNLADLYKRFPNYSNPPCI